MTDGEGVGPRLRPLHAERYRDFEVVGAGGMGVVYAALDTDLNRRVAFKLVRPDFGQEAAVPPTPAGLEPPAPGTGRSRAFDTLRARFLQEAWVTAGLEHPGVVPVYELGRTPEGVPYYTMRFVRGSETLAARIDAVRGQGIEERLALLDPILRVCDTVRYAHAHGVIHRDLKPDNVAIGEFGEVVVLDWGLAKVGERDDVAGELWQERLSAFRKATDLRTMASAMGTPGYMSPEAALGRTACVDERSDVYGLGAILFEALTGRLPYAAETYRELLLSIARAEPVAACDVDPAIPEELSRICGRALSRDLAERTASVAELGAAIRSWRKERAIDQEVRALRREARTAFGATDGLRGDELLRQIDRVHTVCDHVLELRPDDAEATGLVRESEALRHRAIEEGQRATRVRLLKRVILLSSIAAVLVAGATVWMVETKRREAEHERQVAEEERNAKTLALNDVLRLADGREVRALMKEAEELWPLHPDTVPAMEDWMRRVRRLLENRPLHEAALAAVRERAEPLLEEDRLRKREVVLEEIEYLERKQAETQRFLPGLRDDPGAWARVTEIELNDRLAAIDPEISELRQTIDRRDVWEFREPSDAWLHEVLSDVLARFALLADSDECLLQQIERRVGFCRGLEESLNGGHADAWRRAITAIADVEAAPAYGGLRLKPIPGLVPLGRDPRSGLFEFVHVGSGAIPTRDRATGELEKTDDAAIVLVLVPGGTFFMGTQRADPRAPNFDPYGSQMEEPVHEVELSPFLVAKFECTVAQWHAMLAFELRHAGASGPGPRWSEPSLPFSATSWEQALMWMNRHRLTLPTEAQWEYACRAGTTSIWSVGDDMSTLGLVANVADATYGAAQPHTRHSLEVDDGFADRAPVGSFAPNAFGLHDMHGNVWELCLDNLRPYLAERQHDPLVGDPAGFIKVARGGSYTHSPERGRSGDRSSRYRVDTAGGRNGLRPAAPLVCREP